MREGDAISTGERVLIVNADDLGRSPGVNRGVARAHEHGIVTSATMMVRWPAAVEAAGYARGRDLGVGLHLDLGEWELRDGEWHTRYEVLDEWTAEAVAAEIEAQLQRFERLLDRTPTHLDSHQHVHRDAPTRTELARVGERLGIPVREVTPGIRYDGSFYGQDGAGRPLPEAIGVEALCAKIAALPPGVTEFGCHPAAADDHPADYGSERLTEVDALCDARVRATIADNGVALRSFAGL